MSDTSIPPPPPQGQPAPPQSDAALLRQAPVVDISEEALQKIARQGMEIKAQILADRTAQSGTLRLQTEDGEVIVIKLPPSPPRLPTSGDISLELTKQKDILLATLRLAAGRLAVARTTAEASAPLPSAAPPSQSFSAPPVTAGDRLLALLLSGSLPQPTATPSVASPDVLQKAVQAALKNGTIPASALPLSLLAAFATSRDPTGFLNRLPGADAGLLKTLFAADLSNAAPSARPLSPAPVLNGSPQPPGGAATQASPVLSQVSTSSPSSSFLQNLAGIIRKIFPAGDAGATAAPRHLVTPPLTGTTSQGVPNKPVAASLNVQALFPPGTPAGTMTPQPGALLGTVLGQTSQGQPIVNTPQADFVIQTRVHIATGSHIVFTASPIPLEGLAEKPVLRGFSPFLPLTARTWPGLAESFQILGQHAPQAARQLADILPAPGQKMPAATLFLMAALRIGTIESWIGPALLQQIRQHGGRDLAERLSADFARLAGPAATDGGGGGGEWRGLSLPLLYGQDLSQIQLFFRQHQDHDDGTADGQSGRTTRFLVNLHLSRLGEMQIDGLLRQARRPDTSKTLDIVIRTVTRLDDKILSDLQEAYTQGLQQTGLTGKISFQAGPHAGWVQAAGAEKTDDLA